MPNYNNFTIRASIKNEQGNISNIRNIKILDQNRTIKQIKTGWVKSEFGIKRFYPGSRVFQVGIDFHGRYSVPYQTPFQWYRTGGFVKQGKGKKGYWRWAPTIQIIFSQASNFGGPQLGTVLKALLVNDTTPGAKVKADLEGREYRIDEHIALSPQGTYIFTADLPQSTHDGGGQNTLGTGTALHSPQRWPLLFSNGASTSTPSDTGNHLGSGHVSIPLYIPDVTYPENSSSSRLLHESFTNTAPTGKNKAYLQANKKWILTFYPAGVPSGDSYLTGYGGLSSTITQDGQEPLNNGGIISSIGTTPSAFGREDNRAIIWLSTASVGSTTYSPDPENSWEGLATNTTNTELDVSNQSFLWPLLHRRNSLTNTNGTLKIRTDGAFIADGAGATTILEGQPNGAANQIQQEMILSPQRLQQVIDGPNDNKVYIINKSLSSEGKYQYLLNGLNANINSLSFAWTNPSSTAQTAFLVYSNVLRIRVDPVGI